jgi:anti-anti-sigma factor
MNLTLTLATTIATANRSACVRVAGDLNYQTTTDLVDAVTELVARQPGLAHLHLDFSELEFCDSAGLSGLILIERQTSRAGIDLHLEQRPAVLDRILDISGTFEYLVSSSSRSDTATGGPMQRERDAGESGAG